MLDYKQQARALKGTLTILALVSITAAALAFNPGGFTFHELVYGQDTPTIGNQTKVGPTPFKGQLIGTESSDYRYATSFQTANVRHRLDKVVIYISGIGNSNFQVEIWSNNEESSNQGRPGARLVTLSPTSSLSNVLSALDYTPSATLYLEPHATYWLVTRSRPVFAEISLAIGDDEDAGGTRHWSIGDETLRARNATSPTSPSIWSQYLSNPIRMGIYSTPDPGDPVMISNLRQNFLVRDLSQGRKVGTSFTTGSDAKVLKRVRIFASRSNGSTSISANLWSHNDSNHPQTELASLTRVGRASTGQRTMIDFTADQYLEPPSTYWVVVEFSGGAGSVLLASSDHHDPLAAANWQIGNNTKRHVTGATWTQESPDSLKMQVFAGSAPHITRAEITSTPLDGDTYKAGENIEITYTFDVPVDYVQGVAAVYVGAATGQSSYRAAEYMGGSGSRQLLYRYRVKSGDNDTNGVGLEANSLVLQPQIVGGVVQSSLVMGPSGSGLMPSSPTRPANGKGSALPMPSEQSVQQSSNLGSGQWDQLGRQCRPPLASSALAYSRHTARKA